MPGGSGYWIGWKAPAMNTIEELQQRLEILDEEIAETKKRLPAHSVKPPVMMDLLALEDEYEAVLKKIERLKKKESEV
jgi:cell division septum initiation protein DivIVA